jgi:hypothetical protein
MKADTQTPPRGSMGIPPGMRDNLERHQRATAAADKAEAEKEETAAAQRTVDAAATGEPSLDEEVKKYKADYEKDKALTKAKAKIAIQEIESRWKYTIEKADIIALVRTGRITKKDIKIVELEEAPLTVGLQTLTGEDEQAIEEHMHKFRETPNITARSIENEDFFWNLAYSLAMYQGKDTSAVKEKVGVRNAVAKLSAIVLAQLSEALRDFRTVVNLKVRDTDYLKK